MESRTGNTPLPNPCPDGGDDGIADMAKALAHPARLAILRTIAKQSRCNCARICGDLPLAQSTVSQHLKVLKTAGLIQVEADGPNSRYTIATPAMTALVDSLSDLARGLCADDGSCCDDIAPGQPVNNAGLDRAPSGKAST